MLHTCILLLIRHTSVCVCLIAHIRGRDTDTQHTSVGTHAAYMYPPPHMLIAHIRGRAAPIHTHTYVYVSGQENTGGHLRWAHTHICAHNTYRIIFYADIGTNTGKPGICTATGRYALFKGYKVGFKGIYICTATGRYACCIYSVTSSYIVSHHHT
jgi:hypothetical protein